MTKKVFRWVSLTLTNRATANQSNVPPISDRRDVSLKRFFGIRFSPKIHHLNSTGRYLFPKKSGGISSPPSLEDECVFGTSIFAMCVCAAGAAASDPSRGQTDAHCASCSEYPASRQPTMPSRKYLTWVNPHSTANPLALELRRHFRPLQ